jgi:hypothetical protein
MSFMQRYKEKKNKHFYYVKPSVCKHIKLLSVNNVSELSNLGNYLNYTTQLRKESVVN